MVHHAVCKQACPDVCAASTVQLVSAFFSFRLASFIHCRWLHNNLGHNVQSDNAKRVAIIEDIRHGAHAMLGNIGRD